MTHIYLDHNASSPLLASAKAAMTEAFELAGNPSSVHQPGRAIRAVIEQARERLANFVGAREQDVIWTSGGTEANNLALTPSLFPRDLQDNVTLYVSAIEHPSVLNGMRFEKEHIKVIPVTSQGVIDLNWLEGELMNDLTDEEQEQGVTPGTRPILVSVMRVNNETGVIQPITELSALVHKCGGLVHSDCVQALGKVPLDLKELGADLISVSAHKIGGPHGVGALILAGADILLRAPLITGGGQELKRRGGTENVLGIVGFGAAIAEIADTTDTQYMEVKRLRDDLEQQLLQICPEAVIFGKGQNSASRAPHVCCFAVEGLMAEKSIIQLDLAGVAVSSGSACSSGKVEQSHVLKAMGASEAQSFSALRLSLGSTTTKADIDGFIAAWKKLYDRAKPTLKTGEAAA